MTSTTWTERYNFLRFWVWVISVVIGGLFWGVIGLLIVGAVLA